MRNENSTLCSLPGVSAHLEYIPIPSDPKRGLSMPDLPDDDLDEMDGPGPLMTFVLGMGEFFTLAAVFAAFSLMLMVAGA